MENTNNSRDSLIDWDRDHSIENHSTDDHSMDVEHIQENHGYNMSAAPIRTSIRRLHCPLCDRTWEVDVEEYSKVLETPKWLDERCGHWNHHKWKEFLSK